MVTEMLSKALREVLTSAGITAEVVSVVRTQVSSHGDFASNVAIVYEKNIGRNIFWRRRGKRQRNALIEQ